MVTGLKSIQRGQVCLRQINVTASIGIFTWCRQKLKTSTESEQHIVRLEVKPKIYILLKEILETKLNDIAETFGTLLHTMQNY